jgi:quercetin dioxygenase-like cupin family protein
MQLVLLEDRLEAGELLRLDPVSRVLFVVVGTVGVEIDASDVIIHERAAWHGTGPCVIRARAAARVWRWELRADAPSQKHPRTTVKLQKAIALPAPGVLMRADRVDFPLGGVAYTHTHQGPGIRVLLDGRFRVETNDQTMELDPGSAWFERGPDPVYAEVIGNEPASFVRVMILPVTLLGQSSIRYVRDEDRARPKAQTYTVFVDVPITP